MRVGDGQTSGEASDAVDKHSYCASFRCLLSYFKLQLIAEAMLAGKWEAARRAVSATVDGEPRKELARALIPSACDAYAFSVAKTLIEENDLGKEFPELKEMERKRRLIEAVKKPGWKMAQMMLERGAKHEPQLRLWLVRDILSTCPWHYENKRSRGTLGTRRLGPGMQ